MLRVPATDARVATSSFHQCSAEMTGIKRVTTQATTGLEGRSKGLKDMIVTINAC